MAVDFATDLVVLRTCTRYEAYAHDRFVSDQEIIAFYQTAYVLVV